MRPGLAAAAQSAGLVPLTTIAREEIERLHAKLASQRLEIKRLSEERDSLLRRVRSLEDRIQAAELHASRVSESRAEAVRDRDRLEDKLASITPPLGRCSICLDAGVIEYGVCVHREPEILAAEMDRWKGKIG